MLQLSHERVVRLTAQSVRTVGEQKVHEKRAGLESRRRAEGFPRERARVEVEQQHQHLDQDLAAEHGAVGTTEQAVQVKRREGTLVDRRPLERAQ